jgi:hypothetical protein
MKFFAGLAVGILGAFAYMHCNSDENTRGVIIGVLCGIVSAVIAVVMFFQYILANQPGVKKSEPEAEKPWWMKGEKPPWERNSSD